VVGFDTPERHAEIVAPIREALPPLFELVTPIPYIALQQMFNESALWGTFGYEKALYLDDLSDGAIAVIAEHAPKKGTPMSFCPTFSFSGAFARVPDDETAFGGRRSTGFVMNMGGHSPGPDRFDGERTWVRNFWEAMRPHATGSGGYINFQADADDDRVRVSYGPEKYARLAKIKAQYDPDNLFHRNANIKPATR
jgi:hypothetical protein